MRFEIGEETLGRLLAKGQVCAAEFHCLDYESKQCLWRLCLESCKHKQGLCMGERSNSKEFCKVCGNCLKHGWSRGKNS